MRPTTTIKLGALVAGLLATTAEAGPLRSRPVQSQASLQKRHDGDDHSTIGEGGDGSTTIVVSYTIPGFIGVTTDFPSDYFGKSSTSTGAGVASSSGAVVPGGVFVTASGSAAASSSSAVASSNILNNLPTAVTGALPSATTTVSPEIYAKNLADARRYNEQFSSLTKDTTCISGQAACVGGGRAYCNAQGKFNVAQCGSGKKCFVMPMTTVQGVPDEAAKVLAPIAAPIGGGVGAVGSSSAGAGSEVVITSTVKVTQSFGTVTMTVPPPSGSSGSGGAVGSSSSGLDVTVTDTTKVTQSVGPVTVTVTVVGPPPGVASSSSAVAVTTSAAASSVIASVPPTTSSMTASSSSVIAVQPPVSSSASVSSSSSASLPPTTTTDSKTFITVTAIVTDGGSTYPITFTVDPSSLPVISPSITTSNPPPLPTTSTITLTTSKPLSTILPSTTLSFHNVPNQRISTFSGSSVSVSVPSSAPAPVTTSSVTTTSAPIITSSAESSAASSTTSDDDPLVIIPVTGTVTDLPTEIANLVPGPPAVAAAEVTSAPAAASAAVDSKQASEAQYWATVDRLFKPPQYSSGNGLNGNENHVKLAAAVTVSVSTQQMFQTGEAVKETTTTTVKETTKRETVRVTDTLIHNETATVTETQTVTVAGPAVATAA
ncbi:LOW QUALITY PROTEIN: hypothetical protein B0H65DRAFT_508216 [Neurospora tetraspora]|uniref:Carbohydrate-binding module family 19 domain-containing protein n=1 Tax=Neurospora tetraspora TaxID=94610 RepID=A0AAE0JIV2_9PEZI|nr:LOW QUALITY PROTEIN: hypothetical protein B0H65DRAFT_508216 [Neurospora tetraspora]